MRAFRRSISAAVLTVATLATVAGADDRGMPVTRIPAGEAPVAIRSWLVAGVFPSPVIVPSQPNRALRKGFDTDYLASLGGEAKARPRPGTTVRAPDGHAVQFERRDWAGDYVNLVETFGLRAEVVAYLYAEIESPVAQEVWLHFGVNDAGKVWVDGRLVLTKTVDGQALKSQEAARVTLRRGRTPVLVKADQAGANWGIFLEVYGARAHERLVAGAHPDSVRAALAAFDAFRAEIGDPATLSPARRDAYALAAYSAARLEREAERSIASSGGWSRERLLLPGYVARLRAALADARRGVDPYAGRTGLFEAAYLSTADGTAQPFTVCIPRTYTADRRYALLVDLHGASGTHERMGDWWATISARDTSLRETAIGLSVLGRGTHGGYQGLGEIDVLAAIDWVCAHYAIDPDRVYISGGSMGGWGTWHLASRYPDRFAAAWPDCGWPDRTTLPNLLNVPLYVHHSDDDWVVPVSYSRLGVRLLGESGSPVTYVEHTGVGHGVSGVSREKGCLSLMTAHRRASDPDHIRIASDHPRSGRAYWGAIERWIDPRAVARLEARVLPGNVVSVDVANVARAVLAPPARHVDPKAPIVWLVGGNRFVVPPSPDGRYDLVAERDTVFVRPHADEPKPAIRPYAPGSLMNLYYGEPILVVYGTISPDTAVRAAIAAMAEDVRRFSYPGNAMSWGKAPAAADTATTDADLARKNLFIIGGARENALAARLMARMPIREESGALRVFGESIPLDGRGYSFVHPNPEQPARLAFFYGSAVPQFYTFRRSPLASWDVADHGSQVPDLMVHEVARVDSASGPRENRLVRSAYFTHDWRLAPAAGGAIARIPANRGEAALTSARAWRRTTGAAFAFLWSGDREKPVGFVPATPWADLATLSGTLVTFDVSGADLVALLRPIEFGFPWIDPAPDSSAIDPARDYRVVAVEWVLWDLAQQRRFNPRNVRPFDDTARLDAYLREEWGVRPAEPGVTGR